MIPKIIHYCWFGGNPLPKLAKKCIKSWKKYCKGYTIKEWNEDNFDISAAPLYVRQAYEAKKWAFVSDYVRLWAMVNFGGIYMDTDVEVIKNIDGFLAHEAVSGFESDRSIPTGLMACRKDFPLFDEMLHEYDHISFINDDGTYDYTTNVDRITRICTKHGFLPNGELQNIEGFIIYPKEFFCPKQLGTLKEKIVITNNTYTIHHFTGSWLPKEEIDRIKKWKADEKKYNRSMLFDKITHLPNRVAKGILGDSLYSKLKNSLKK